VSSKAFKAAVEHYKAKISEAELVLDVYLNKSVGIGEHPDILKPILDQVEALTEAKECLRTLEELQRKAIEDLRRDIGT
jgi:hypothetical protein|tara:strand:- start:92 stop:328 length:237 start_codon:yes stop_codon:yes gene_type:complete